MNYESIVEKYSGFDTKELTQRAINIGQELYEKIKGLESQFDDFNAKVMIGMSTLLMLSIDREIDEKEYNMQKSIAMALGLEVYDHDQLRQVVNFFLESPDMKDNAISFINVADDSIPGIKILFAEYFTILACADGKIGSEEKTLIQEVLSGTTGFTNPPSSTLTEDVIHDGSAQPLEVKEMGATIASDDDDCRFLIGAVINNPNKTYVAVNTTIKVIVYDDSGSVLLSRSEIISFIDIDSNFNFGVEYVTENGTPSKYEVLVATDRFEKYDQKFMVGLNLSNFSFNKAKWGDYTFRGNITNNYNKKLNFVKLFFVFRDSNRKIIGGCNTYVSDLFAGSTDGFDINVSADFSHFATIDSSVDFDYF